MKNWTNPSLKSISLEKTETEGLYMHYYYCEECGHCVETTSHLGVRFHCDCGSYHELRAVYYNYGLESVRCSCYPSLS